MCWEFSFGRSDVILSAATAGRGILRWPILLMLWTGAGSARGDIISANL
jgi:hypothetical protein